MLIDLLFASAMVLAIFKGLKNGLVIAVFSIIAWVAGLYAALRFSYVAADYLKAYVSPRWLTILSFVAIFLLVVVLVRLGANLIGKALDIAMLGWINRMGGIVFYVILYAFIFSVVIFFADKVRLLSEEAISSSKIYPWIKPFSQVARLSLLH